MFAFENGGRPPSYIWYDVIADCPQLVSNGLNIFVKLHVDHVNILQDIAIFISGCIWLEICLFNSRPLFRSFGGYEGVLLELVPAQGVKN